MGEIVIDKPYPKQIEFFKADSKYIAYGGARGGGKSWAARTKAVLLALNYTGIQIPYSGVHLQSLEKTTLYHF